MCFPFFFFFKKKCAFFFNLIRRRIMTIGHNFFFFYSVFRALPKHPTHAHNTLRTKTRAPQNPIVRSCDIITETRMTLEEMCVRVHLRLHGYVVLCCVVLWPFPSTNTTLNHFPLLHCSRSNPHT